MKHILNARLAEIDARLAEIQIAVANLPRDGSYQRQELLTEQNELKTLRRMTERALHEVAAPPKFDERCERFVQAEVAIRREQHLAFIQKLEDAGDYRQARIWRAELLSLRSQVEREFPRKTGASR